MNRREFVQGGLAAGVGGARGFSDPVSGADPHFYEIRFYQLRNDIEPKRINDFFEGHFMPMAKRQNIGPVGCFNVMAGLYSPALMLVIDYRSLSEMQAATERMKSDSEYLKAWRDFETGAPLAYVRYESSLLKAFTGHPRMEVPPAPAGRGRVFELRVYESKNAFSLQNKIEMFNQEEIKIFKDCGFATVFFGEGVCGTRLPHLTYMIGFDSMEARDKAWGQFGASPDWARIRNKPGWTDAEAVSNIHASFLRPTAYSQIR